MRFRLAVLPPKRSGITIERPCPICGLFGVHRHSLEDLEGVELHMPYLDANNNVGILVPAGTTTTQSSQPIYETGAKLEVIINITAGAGSVTVTISGQTPQGFNYTILTSTALSGAGTTVLRVFPGATAAANLTVNDMVPKNVFVTATVSGACTYGIDYQVSV